jgi:hypothetical protein
VSLDDSEMYAPVGVDLVAFMRPFTLPLIPGIRSDSYTSSSKTRRQSPALRRPNYPRTKHFATWSRARIV